MSSISVAVVDDDESLRAALVELIEHEEKLELAGTAADAEAGIELVGRVRPDVALVDVRMAGGGAHATETMLGRSPATRVIALSAQAGRAAVLECSARARSATWSRAAPRRS